MNILIISSSDPRKTSGIVAYDLYRGLKRADGANSIEMLVKYYYEPNKENIYSYQTNHFHERIEQLTRKVKSKWKNSKSNMPVLNKQYSFQDYDQSTTYYPTRKILKKINMDPDIIIYLFPQGFVLPRNIYELHLATKAPVVLFPMDMSFMTGGCHYAWDCLKYQMKCGNCPALFSEYEMDQSRRNWENKNDFYERTPISVIAASEQLRLQLIKSSLFKDSSIHKILLPIDDNLFTQGNKHDARSILSLPADKLIVLFGAAGFPKRKGYFELVESLIKVKGKLGKDHAERIHLAIVGNEQKINTDSLPFPFSVLGYLSYQKLATAFQAADVFVSPSIQDSGPMMINQSLMCGTPVVSFQIGVALDLVRDGITGYSSPVFDTDSLSDGIIRILEMDKLQKDRIGTSCRELAVSKSSTQTVAIEIFKFLQQVIDSRMNK